MPLARRLMALQSHRENLIVDLVAASELWRQHPVGDSDDDIAPRGGGHALGQDALVTQIVQIAGHLPRVAAQLGKIFFEVVDFFDDVDGNHDVVLFECEKRAGVVEKNVGVQHKDFFHVAPRCPMFCSMPHTRPKGQGQHQPNLLLDMPEPPW